MIPDTLLQLSCVVTLPRVRARRGAAWADVHEPGWADYVDPDLIDIASWWDCILGQVARHRHDTDFHALAARHHLTGTQMVKLGFDGPIVHLRLLNRAWARETRARRRAPAGVVPVPDDTVTLVGILSEPCPLRVR